MKPETFISNLTSSKFYKDFVELHPHLSHKETRDNRNKDAYVGSYTPKKNFSPGKTKHDEVLVEEIQSPSRQTQRTPDKRNQRMTVTIKYYCSVFGL